MNDRDDAVDVLFASAPSIPVTLDSALDVTGDPSVVLSSSPELPDFDDLRETEVKLPAAPPLPKLSSSLPPLNPPPRRPSPTPSFPPVASPTDPPPSAVTTAKTRARVVVHGRPNVLWGAGLVLAGAVAAAAAVTLVVNVHESGAVRDTASAPRAHASLAIAQPTPRSGHVDTAARAAVAVDDAALAAAAAPPIVIPVAPRAKPAARPPAPKTQVASAPAPKTAPAPKPAAPPAIAAAPQAPPAPAAPPAARRPATTPEDVDALAREQLKAALR